MKEIENDARVAKVRLHSGDVGLAHVHDHLCDLFCLRSVRRHGGKELRNGLCTTPFDYEQKVISLLVEHDCHIAMPFARAGFVNHQTA